MSDTIDLGKASVGGILKHYGKKGMKWGVRNDKGHEGEAVKTKKLDKLDKKWEKDEERNAFWQAHNAAAEKMNNGEIDRINNKPEHKKAADEGKFDDWDNPTPELNAYMADMDNTFASHMRDAVVARGANPSGTKRYELRQDDEGNAWAELVDVKHASVGDIDVRFKITRDVKGRVIKYTPEEVELKHYGVKGMRWGVTTKDRAAQTDPQAVSVVQKKPGKFAKTSGGTEVPIHDDAVNALVARQKAKSSTTDALSNAELRQAVDRMQLEQKYSQLAYANDRRSRGAKFVAGLFGQRKDLKFKDLDEEAGEKTREAIAKAFEERKRAQEAA